MRGRDLTVGEPNWLYNPLKHKNSWRGQERVIILWLKAQSVVKAFLKDDPSEWMFKPDEAVAGHHVLRSENRRSKPTPSELSRRRPSPRRSNALRYDHKTYRHAIARACDKARVPRCSPLQLRHTAAPLIRTRFGLEAAQIVLGHARADVTQVYAEPDMISAHSVMTEIG